MAKFRANEHEGQTYEHINRAGQYVLFLSRFLKRSESKRGKPFLMFQAMACTGPKTGATMIHRVYLSEKSYPVLASFCKRIGEGETEFDLDSDHEVARVLMLKPFGATVSISNGYANIDQWIDLTAKEMTEAEAFVAKYEHEFEGDVFERADIAKKAAGGGDDSWSDDPAEESLPPMETYTDEAW